MWLDREPCPHAGCASRTIRRASSSQAMVLGTRYVQGAALSTVWQILRKLPSTSLMMLLTPDFHSTPEDTCHGLPYLSDGCYISPLAGE